MYDSFNRKINYLRISVTDRCNLRCTYCMPEDGIRLIPHEAVLRFEEIVEIVTIAASLGITKIRITGGEPLVRKGVPELVRMIAAVPGIEDLAMTTNGILLAPFAQLLKKNGLQRVNVSMDTIDPDRFRIITRGGEIQEVIRGIDAALEAGLLPVKINCVVHHTVKEPDAVEVGRFADAKGIQVRYIHQMDLKNGHYSQVEGGEGGRCSSCNRLRLTADGKIKPCLFNDMRFDTKVLGIENALLMAVGKKPASGTVNCSGHFYNIGG